MAPAAAATQEASTTVATLGRPTDTLRLSLETANKEPASIGELLLKLEQFGEVSRVNQIEDSGSNERFVEVSFFDVRAAASAKAALGESCSFATQREQRCLRLLGAAGLEAAVVGGISDIGQSQDGDFLVEFFDSRVAAQVASSPYAVAADASSGEVPRREGCKLEPLESAVAATVVAPAFDTESRRPRYVNDLRMSQVRWDDLASNREWRTTLHLRGLPRALCEPNVLRSLLESQGLLDSVESLRMVPTKGKQLGNALLNAKTVSDVPKLAKFFHGRQFGGSMPVAVSFAARQGQGSSASTSALGSSLRRPRKAERSDLAEPWRVGISEFTLRGVGLESSRSDDPAYAASTLSSTPRLSSSSDIAPDEAPHSPTILTGLLSPPPGLEKLQPRVPSLESLPPCLE